MFYTNTCMFISANVTKEYNPNFFNVHRCTYGTKSKKRYSSRKKHLRAEHTVFAIFFFFLFLFYFVKHLFIFPAYRPQSHLFIGFISFIRLSPSFLLYTKKRPRGSRAVFFSEAKTGSPVGRSRSNIHIIIRRRTWSCSP